MNKKKRGRPPKPTTRSQTIVANVTPSEAKAIHARARRAGMSVSEYARERLGLVDAARVRSV